MLSKEIALRSVQLVHSENAEERGRLKADILLAVDRMENSHAQLLTAGSSNVRAVYFEEPRYLDAELRDFMEQARALTQLPDQELALQKRHAAYILSVTEGSLLTLLEETTNEFQQKSERTISRLQQITLYSLFSAFLVLLLEAIFIFRPMVKAIEREKKELLVLNQELELHSLSDGLTGVANRRHFDNRVRLEWSKAEREQAPLALLMLDIDFFKSYNDTYGHLAGDDCLKQVACAVAATVKRPGDLTARYGGEEFAVLLPGTDATGALTLAEQVRRSVEELQIPHSGSRISAFVTVSIGTAVAVPAPRTNVNVLIAAADSALYQAKANGRNKVEYSDAAGV